MLYFVVWLVNYVYAHNQLFKTEYVPLVYLWIRLMYCVVVCCTTHSYKLLAEMSSVDKPGFADILPKQAPF